MDANIEFDALGFIIIETKMGDVTIALPDEGDGEKFVFNAEYDEDDGTVESVTLDFEPDSE